MNPIDLSFGATFCQIDTPGGHFWSRAKMVREGVELFLDYKAQCIAQGCPEGSFSTPVFLAVMNSQAITMYNVAPSGRA